MEEKAIEHRARMMKPLKLTIVICVLGVSACTHFHPFKGQPSQSEQVKTAVEQFCKMDAAGTWLGSERWNELGDFVDRVGPWHRPLSIAVLRNYRVGTPQWDNHGGYLVEVDNFVWGTIDPFLHFSRAQTPAAKAPGANGPVQERRYEMLALTDSFVEVNEAREEKEKKAALRWRKTMSYYSSNIDVDTAIRYVVEQADKSHDPVTKYNGARTLAVLRSLSAGVPLPVQPARAVQQSASERALQFIDLETRMGPDQWADLTKFFMETPNPLWNEIQIIDGVGTAASPEGKGINAATSTIQFSADSLGELDSSLRLSNYPAVRIPPGSASACDADFRFEFTMLLTDVHWEIAPDGAVRQINGPYEWRFEEHNFMPLITLDTAIRYVTGGRAKTSNTAIKKNADRTLTILNLYKQSVPLPDYLRCNSGVGCSE